MKIRFKLIITVVTFFLILSYQGLRGGETDKPLVELEDTVAIIGDSITAQHLYSAYIETYLVACHPDLQVKCIQFGRPAETTGGLLARIESDILPWEPDLVLSCYGMNDGRYKKYEKSIGHDFQRNLSSIVQRLMEKKAKVLIGSPGIVDPVYFVAGEEAAEIYNANLFELSKIAQSVSEQFNCSFADIHVFFKKTISKMSTLLNVQYPFAPDGIHPVENGQLVMATEFLNKLNLDKEIGRVSVNWTGGAKISVGHKLLNKSQGKYLIESTRYPFCTPSTKSGQDYKLNELMAQMKFHENLNQFNLVVSNLPDANYMVQWGKESVIFSSKQLEQGVNLAQTFKINPFSDAFENIFQKVVAKQDWEFAVYNEILQLQNENKSIEKYLKNQMKVHTKYVKKLHDLITPIEHVIKISVIDEGVDKTTSPADSVD